MDHTLISDIAYINDGHPRHTLDLYIPGSNKGPYPTVIYIHGGAFKFGSKESEHKPLRLLSQDYAIASINYRLSGDAIFPAAVQDCKAAVRFVRANSAKYNLDPERLVSMGESAGAYMACMVGITGPLDIPSFHAGGDHLDTSSAVRGFIDFYGPTDFSQMDAHAPKHADMVHDAADSPESLFLGRQITLVPELVQAANPITYVGDETPPALVAHGTGDAIVPFHQSLLLEEALRAKRREVLFHPVEGVDHVWKGISADQQRSLDETLDGWLKDLFRA